VSQASPALVTEPLAQNSEAHAVAHVPLVPQSHAWSSETRSSMPVAWICWQHVTQAEAASAWHVWSVVPASMPPLLPLLLPLPLPLPPLLLPPLPLPPLPLPPPLLLPLLAHASDACDWASVQSVHPAQVKDCEPTE
jgi:hypothetical protein